MMITMLFATSELMQLNVNQLLITKDDIDFLYTSTILGDVDLMNPLLASFRLDQSSYWFTVTLYSDIQIHHYSTSVYHLSCGFHSTFIGSLLQ